mmetsp:Transcript_6209/g.11097  ORF Transcript_6209/g.11097 Transcript_6209/m.11097 type:complete len:220 (+) Transcript_6209:1588-2247(+)
MCHPHSVRIQMKRLKFLLDSYEKDACYRETMGLPQLTYSNWAKHEAKRVKKEMRGCENKQILLNEGGHGLNSMNIPTALNASIAIEITKESVTSRKKKKRKTFRRQEFNEWRVAKRVKPGLYVQNTQVICMIECGDVDHPTSNNEFEFFIGTIVKLVDGHVKIHLVGLGKKDDLWFEQGSDHLFLDGGLTDPPSSGNENDKNILKTVRGKVLQRKKNRG